MKRRSLLRVLRAAQQPKLTQYEIARAANIGQARYWQIENGYGPEPRESEKASLAVVLGVKPDDIAWPEREPKPSAEEKAAS